VISALLGVFAAAISDTDSRPKKEEKEGESQIKLVRLNCIAARLAGAVGLLGLCQLFGVTQPLNPAPVTLNFMGLRRVAEMFPASPREGFNPASAEMGAPVGIQLLVISLLLAVFAAAISDSDGRPKNNCKKATSQVELVRLNRIAARLAGAVGLTSLCKIFDLSFKNVVCFFEMLPTSPREGFNPVSVEMEVPVGIQLLLLSALLAVFAAAISDIDYTPKEPESEEKSQVQLVRANCIAARLAGAVALAGCCKTFDLSGLMRFVEMIPASPYAGFNPANVEMEVPLGIQLLLMSTLIAIFAAAISDDDISSQKESEDKGRSQIELVRANYIAARLAGTVGLIGLWQTVRVF